MFVAEQQLTSLSPPKKTRRFSRVFCRIVGIDTARNGITVAVSNQGKISVCTFDLKTDGERFFFE